LYLIFPSLIIDSIDAFAVACIEVLVFFYNAVDNKACMQKQRQNENVAEENISLYSRLWLIHPRWDQPILDVISGGYNNRFS